MWKVPNSQMAPLAPLKVPLLLCVMSISIQNASSGSGLSNSVANAGDITRTGPGVHAKPKYSNLTVTIGIPTWGKSPRELEHIL